MDYAIKCREVGKKAWAFLTPRGGLSRLRIHAARFDTVEKARALIDANKDDNPEWQFRVVDFTGKEVTAMKWIRVTRDRYWEMLEVLPPAVMGGGAFMVGEPMSHDPATGQPSEGAWQRMLNNSGVWAGKCIIDKLTPKEGA